MLDARAGPPLPLQEAFGSPVDFTENTVDPTVSINMVRGCPRLEAAGRGRRSAGQPCRSAPPAPAAHPHCPTTQVHHGIEATAIAAAVVFVFIWLRFDLGFALGGLFSMASSGIFALSCFALGGYEVDVTFVVRGGD